MVCQATPVGVEIAGIRMFNSESSFAPPLRPEAYCSESSHQLEVSRLFQDSWHLVGSTCDLAEDGRYLTTRVLGHPIICWHRDGQIRSFSNACGRLCSPLIAQASGTLPVLQCQFHGCRYGGDGARIRNRVAAGSKSADEESSNLTSLPTHTCGNLIFVSLCARPVPFQEWIGADGHARCLDLFGGKRLHNLDLDLTLEGNWKLIVENALESYHVDTVHANTFGHAPPAESCTHTMFENGSTFSTVEPPPASAEVLFEKLMHQLIGVERRELFEHAIYYPNLMMGGTKIYSWVMTSTPVSATTSRLRYLMFSRDAGQARPGSRMVLALMNRMASRYARRVMMEDVAIMPAVQRGLSSAGKRAPGVISTREERVFHFQDHVSRVGLSFTNRSDEL